MASKRLFYLIPIGISIFYFLSVKLEISSFIYLILVLPVALWFFPIRLIVYLKNNSETSITNRILTLVSGFLFAAVICLSAVYLFMEESRTFKTIIELFGLGILGLAVYYYTARKDTYNFILHFCFLFIVSAVVVV